MSAQTAILDRVAPNPYDQLAGRLWRAAWLVEQVGMLMQRRRGAAGTELARIDAELHRLRADFAATAGGLIPKALIDADSIAALARIVETGRAATVPDALRVLDADRRAAQRQRSEDRVRAIERQAADQAQFAAREAVYANARRTRRAIRDLGRKLR